MIKITIEAGEKAYPVFLGHGIIKDIGAVLGKYLSKGQVLVITDKNVAAIYANKCLESLRREGFKPSLEVLEAKETTKSLETVSALYTKALEAGLDRHSAIIALGGGVIGDLAGFVAATYLRGVPFVQMPTTLLAMVDSSVGGKVGVNHPLGKNLIGAFYQPSLVLGDLDTLKTLPPREIRAGLAELVKYGAVCDRKLFELLEVKSSSFRGEALLGGGKPRLLSLIGRAVMIKGEIVRRDEKEKGLRRLLNFGHTFGHALEQAGGFEYYLHGEAVACGMFMATRLAMLLDKLDEPSGRRISALVKKLNPPRPPEGLTLQAVEAALFYDKKKEGEKMVFVLPAAIGKGALIKDPPAPLVKRVLEEYLRGELL